MILKTSVYTTEFAGALSMRFSDALRRTVPAKLYEYTAIQPHCNSWLKYKYLPILYELRVT